MFLFVFVALLFSHLRGLLCSSLSKSHTEDKTTIWLLTIRFITLMINNHLCCQSANMSGYRNNSPEAGTKQFNTQPDLYPPCLNNHSVRHCIWKYIYLCTYRHCFCEQKQSLTVERRNSPDVILSVHPNNDSSR